MGAVAAAPVSSQERISGIRDQALIVAGALAEYTAMQDRRTIDTAQAEPLLRR